MSFIRGKYEIQSYADAVERFGEQIAQILIPENERETFDQTRFPSNLLNIADEKIRSELVEKYFGIFQQKPNSITYKRLLKNFQEYVSQNPEKTSHALQDQIDQTRTVFEQHNKAKKKKKAVALQLNNNFVIGPSHKVRITELRSVATNRTTMQQISDTLSSSRQTDPDLQRKNPLISDVHLKMGRLFLTKSPFKTEEIQQLVQKTMVEGNCSLWFTLHEFNEKKTNPFWLNKQIKAIELENGWAVNSSKDNETRAEAPELKETLLHLNSSDGKSAVVQHIHYDRWKDKHAASDRKLLLDCALLAKTHLQQKKEAVGINCRAGVGRTGVLATAISAISFIDQQVQTGLPLEQIEIDIPQLRYDIQRGGRVVHGERIEQLSQTYEVVADYVDVLLQREEEKIQKISKIQAFFRRYHLDKK